MTGVINRRVDERVDSGEEYRPIVGRMKATTMKGKGRERC